MASLYENAWQGAAMRRSKGLAVAALFAAVFVWIDGSKATGNTDWPFTGGDPGGTHYSLLAQIRVENVRALGLGRNRY